MDDVKQAELLAKIKQWQADMTKTAPQATSEWDAKDKQRLEELAGMDPAEMLASLMNVSQKAKDDAKMTDCSDEYFAEAKLIASRTDNSTTPGFEGIRRDISLYQHPDGRYIRIMDTNGNATRKIISDKVAGWMKRGLTPV